MAKAKIERPENWMGPRARLNPYNTARDISPVYAVLAAGLDTRTGGMGQWTRESGWLTSEEGAYGRFTEVTSYIGTGDAVCVALVRIDSLTDLGGTGDLSRMGTLDGRVMEARTSPALRKRVGAPRTWSPGHQEMYVALLVSALVTHREQGDDSPFHVQAQDELEVPEFEGSDQS